jgi:hypothetical protein
MFEVYLARSPRTKLTPTLDPTQAAFYSDAAPYGIHSHGRRRGAGYPRQLLGAWFPPRPALDRPRCCPSVGLSEMCRGPQDYGEMLSRLHTVFARDFSISHLIRRYSQLIHSLFTHIRALFALFAHLRAEMAVLLAHIHTYSHMSTPRRTCEYVIYTSLHSHWPVRASVLCVPCDASARPCRARAEWWRSWGAQG